MLEGMSRTAARNIFIGGSVFFAVVFLALTAHSHYYAVTESTNSQDLSPAVKRGKHVWEQHSCINCHTLLGEGAYFAPELGNVWVRFGGRDNPEGARAALKGWIRAQPTGAPGRRQMPAFDLTEQELDDLISFLAWTSRIDTQGWPPHPSG